MEIIRNVIRDIIRDIKPEVPGRPSVLPCPSCRCWWPGLSLIYVRRSAKASREQTKQQKQAAKDAAQPMVWVDVRGVDGQGQALALLLGTRGGALPAM